jgi:uncharacterized membrane protein (Fun14 family)
MEEQREEQEEQRKRGDRWILILIFLLFLVGLGIRGYSYVTDSKDRMLKGESGTYWQQQPPTTFRDSLRSGEDQKIRLQEQPSSGEIDLLTELAPYLTEGGLSFFLGFCIGYFLRLVAKTAVFVVGGLYVCLILLSHYGMITVDWGSFQDLLQQLLLNTKTQVEGLQGIITVGLPSVTMGCLGIWRGLKK